MYGYARNVWLLVWTLLALLAAGAALAAPALANNNQALAESAPLCAAGGGCLGLVLFLCYLFSRRMYLAVETGGGQIVGVWFKGSFVEGVAVTLDKTEQVVEIMNRLMAAQTKV
jgi:hypothetical protein